MKTPRKYNPELKAEVIKLLTEERLTQIEVSQRLGIPAGTIGNWASRYAAEAHANSPEGEQSYAELKAENERLRKELMEARLEREILKKATAYFAKESLLGTHS
jgi:transposase